MIERSAYAAYYEANAKRLQAQEQLYKRRQAIVEHTYGIIKRQWGFYFISTKKTIQHAAADVGMIFTAFNLRRLCNLLPKNELQAHLKGLGYVLSTITALLQALGRQMPLFIPTRPFLQNTFSLRSQPAEMRYIR